MSQYYQDLIRIGSYTLRQIDRPYSLNDAWESSAQNLYQQLKLMMRQHNRIMIMVYSFYFGELIQLSVTPRAKWDEFVKEQQIPNSYYLYRGIIRTYQLFEKDSSQIYRTVTLTFNVISRMKATEYQNLLQYSRELHDVINNINIS